MMLKCNNLKCRREIERLALITYCSHIFCYQCYPTVKRIKACLACDSLCDEDDYTIQEMDVKPCLVGCSPEEILECVQKALSFWIYQMDQELTIENLIRREVEESTEKEKNEARVVIDELNVEIEEKTQKINRLEGSLERERQNNYDLNVMLSNKSKECRRLITAIEGERLKQDYSTPDDVDQDYPAIYHNNEKRSMM